MIDNNIKTVKPLNISIVENFIIGGTFTPITLGQNLEQLRALRKKYYSNLIEKVKSSEDFQKDYIYEYTNFCNFNGKLICSKKLPRVIFSRILQEFINDYDFVKPLDTDKYAYQMTLDTLSKLSVALKNSESITRQQQLLGINKLIKKFIEENKTPDSQML